MSAWPNIPGLWTRDMRPWPPKDQQARKAFVDYVASRVAVVFFGDRRLQALAMACFIREGGASRLAMAASNLYGITHSLAEPDLSNYPIIRFAGNAHDKSVGIDTRFYRVYSDVDACLRNWLWHMEKSSLYRHLWPVWLEGRDEEYILAMRWVWANKNEEDGPSVVKLYRARLADQSGRTIA